MEKSIAILFLICIAFSLSAQEEIPTNEDLKLFIFPKPTNNQLIVKGKIKNLKSQTYQLKYVLSVVERNNSSFKSRQRNKFQLDSLAELDLGEVIVPFNPNAIYDINLEIFHDTVLISYIAISNETVKPTNGAGLIIDITRSKNGNDFYKLFNKYWLASEIETNAMIKIEERPGRSRSTQILIFVNNDLVMRQMLNTRYDQIKNQAKYGIAVTRNFLQKNLHQNKFEEDLLGNGLN